VCLMFAVRNTPGAIKGNDFCDKFILKKKDGLSAQGTSTCLNDPYIYDGVKEDACRCLVGKPNRKRPTRRSRC
jgi:hypothetical protein